MIMIKNYINNKINSNCLRCYDTGNGVCIDVKRDCSSQFHNAGIYIDIKERKIEGDIPSLSPSYTENIIFNLEQQGFKISDIHYHQQDEYHISYEEHIHFEGKLCKSTIDFIICYLEKINNDTIYKHSRG